METISNLKIDPELFEKYAKSGPRYTSYPTAPTWHEGVHGATYQRVLENGMDKKEEISLYLHFPFCPSHCSFCGCNVIITSNQDVMKSYVDTLIDEIQALSPYLKNKTVRQIQWGGGSPSYLTPAEFRRIHSALKSSFTFHKEMEAGIELNPDNTNEKLLDAIFESGYHRISLGVQDLDEKVQKVISREIPFEVIRDVVIEVRRRGASSLNFDLIYGLPAQTMESFSSTLEKIAELSPDRMALYSYAHVPWLKPLQRHFEKYHLPDNLEKLSLFLKALEFFSTLDYEFLGLDHFAKKSDPLAIAHRNGTMQRNFMGYTTHQGLDYYGLGMTSIGYVQNKYFQNHKKLNRYQNAIQSGEFATEKGFELNFDDVIRQYVINSLMVQGKLKSSDFFNRFGLKMYDYLYGEFQDLRTFQRDGLLKVDREGVEISPLGSLFLRNIAMVFDSYLGKMQDSNLFSKTV